VNIMMVEKGGLRNREMDGFSSKILFSLWMKVGCPVRGCHLVYFKE